MNFINPEVAKILAEGCVIPAHPLALDKNRNFDTERQRLLTRYYMASGAGGVAVGVHSTQFEIRNPHINLLEPVLKIASEEIDKATPGEPFIKVAGIVGPTEQALKEAAIAVKYGYDLGLVSMGGLQDWTDLELIRRVEKIAEVIPVFGFYLQPSVGGRYLSYEFWKDFAQVENVHAIKIAAFNRYQTLDVVRAICNSSRSNEIALYTGNDDNIIADLITPYRFLVNGGMVEKRFVGGLLGHWAVWTHKAVKLLDEIKHFLRSGTGKIPLELLTRNIEVTDANAAIFDPSHSFAGCIPGIHEILRRQGLLKGRWCLNPDEELSKGQMLEIDRIYKSYPHLHDDDFVHEHMKEWMLEL